jgi:hypothetical protein
MRAVWRSAFSFALAGPMIGFGLAAAAGSATFAWRALVKGEDVAPPDGALSALAPLLILALVGAYAVGAPAAFIVGAAMRAMSERVFSAPAIVATAVLIGAAVSAATVYTLDEYALPHPHLGAAPMFGASAWAFAGGVGALSAAICALAALRRDGRGSNPRREANLL